MFTGLVEEIGLVLAPLANEGAAILTIQCSLVCADTSIGDSVAVNGCCLTVVARTNNTIRFEAVPETLARTNLGMLTTNSRVNLERAVAVGSRMGGHFVQGHIDGVGQVTDAHLVENALVLTIEGPQPLNRYFVEKGSVSVDGVSLTIASVQESSFAVWIIPHTRAATTLGSLSTGCEVNLECDMLGKYVEKLLASQIETH